MGDLLQPWHIILLVVLAVLLLGGKKSREPRKGLGEVLRGGKEGLKGINEEIKPDAKPA
ncbi:MAG: twin-arginine translocase TatA/TatE family subunit, partial [Acidobacteriota bacterium]